MKIKKYIYINFGKNLLFQEWKTIIMLWVNNMNMKKMEAKEKLKDEKKFLKHYSNI